ncbi:hypothetical protein CGCSCA4_v000519 [Colletotrichum siamense]|uniref:Uncharacterized protein n=1 Tax=Colletotrichum siamense TaxID=690259 RepID=A0A9P5EUV7_COLSI|nr:hypothetical protein CGCSCA4_v000519 [Colletotrichum siamense]KAF4860472.1 hypothetical protein CGCSCA2_v005313 [Colletotrichum siamense]
MRKYNIGEPESSASPASQHSESSPVEIYSCDGDCAIAHSISDVIREDQTVGIQAAEVLLAVCDTEGAWKEFKKAENNGSIYLTALARSAETENQCKVTLDLLGNQIFPSSIDPDLPQLCLLYALVCDNFKCGLGDKTQTIADAVSACAVVINSFLLRDKNSVDLVHYILLDNFMQNHDELLDDMCKSQLQFYLSNVDTWVLTGSMENTMQSSSFCDDSSSSLPVRVLQQCLVWCCQQLHHVSNDLDYTMRLQINIHPGEYQAAWKDVIELFGTLWRILKYQFISKGKWPKWAGQSVEAMNISHAETLSYVCWLLVNPKNIIGSSEGEQDLFVRSRLVAHDVFHWSSEALWVAFREAFERFNRLTVADGKENRDFGAAAIEQFRAFVRITLYGSDDSNAALTADMAGLWWGGCGAG